MDLNVAVRAFLGVESARGLKYFKNLQCDFVGLSLNSRSRASQAFQAARAGDLAH